MAWIESHQNLQRHPKTLRAAAKLGVPVPMLIGHLHCLWWWCLDFAQDGDLTGFDHAEIAQAAMWPGDPTAFVDALQQCGQADRPGFLEMNAGHLLIHDWFDYAGKLIERRQHEAEHAKRKRALYHDPALTRHIRERDRNCCRYCGRVINWMDRRGPAAGCYDHIDPQGPNTAENLVVACRACNSQKRDRTLEEAQMTLLPPLSQELGRNQVGNQVGTRSVSKRNPPTVPNRTVPNRTTPNQKRGRTRAARAPSLKAEKKDTEAGVAGSPVPERQKSEVERILDGVAELAGYPVPHFGKEAREVKKALRQGYTPEQIRNCWDAGRQSPRWRGIWFPFAYVVEDLGEFVKGGGKPLARWQTVRRTTDGGPEEHPAPRTGKDFDFGGLRDTGIDHEL